MRRVAHIISKPKLNSLPKEVIFFDTETYETITGPKSKILKLKVGYALRCSLSNTGSFRDRNDHVFSDTLSFNNWLVAECIHQKTYWLVAHNIGFDLRITETVAFLTAHDWERKTFIEDGINFICVFYKAGTYIKIVNNQQYFNCSLKYLGDSIGIKKLNVNFTQTTDDELLNYCKRDVWIMREAWRIWIDYIRVNKLGSFKMTAASQSMEAFRHSFMDHDIFIHTNPRATELERKSYHGGRVDCMYIGHFRDGPIYNLDINSMYPAQMLKPVPIKLLKYYGKANNKIYEAYKDKFGYIIQATINIHKACIAVQAANGKLVFPTGIVQGTFTKPDIQEATKYGDVVEVQKMALYEEADVFRGFVDFFYNSRQRFKREGNEAFGYITKLLMNSLYGKFAQRKIEYKKIGKTKTIPDGIYFTKWPSAPFYAKMRVFSGVIERETKAEEGYNSFTAISSYITAYARSYLNEIINTAGRENTLYCDTDSIFVTEAGFHRVKHYIDNTALGMLKLVGIEPNMTIWAPKRYRFGNKLVQKGIRANATAIAERAFEQDKFMSFRYAMRTNNLQGVAVTRIVKRCIDHYDKGVILPDGSVQPLHFPAVF